LRRGAGDVPTPTETAEPPRPPEPERGDSGGEAIEEEERGAKEPGDDETQLLLGRFWCEPERPEKREPLVAPNSAGDEAGEGTD
jgi:hypothetical protein